MSRRFATALAIAAAATAVAWRIDIARSPIATTTNSEPRVVSVWRCFVPLATRSDWFEPSTFRLDLSVAELVDRLGPVTEWLNHQSNGLFAPEFVAGGDVASTEGDGPEGCVESVEQAFADIDGRRPLILVVATAQHRGDRPGGWGRDGIAYVGAADFHPDWGTQPPLDLVEHELGHAIGMAHSGVDDELNSALDAMSDSAAPRRVDPTRRHSPSVLAVHRQRLGWIQPNEVAHGSRSGGEIVLLAQRTLEDGLSVAGAAGNGERVVLALLGDPSDGPPLALEVKRAVGHDAHLQRAGVIIHRVESDGDLTPLVGTAPFDRPLADGEQWTGDGWTIAVSEVRSTESGPASGGDGRVWRVNYRFDERLRSG